MLCSRRLTILLQSWTPRHWSVFSWVILALKGDINIILLSLVWCQLMWYFLRLHHSSMHLSILQVRGRKKEWLIYQVTRVVIEKSEDVLPYPSLLLSTNPLLFHQHLLNMCQQDRLLFKFTWGGGKSMIQFLYHQMLLCLILHKILTSIFLFKKYTSV